MKALLTLATLMLFAPAFSHAADLTSSAPHCSAKSIEQYYCPVNGGWWYGPYFDNGCSVKCEQNQKAVCHEATCDENSSGEAVPSDCHCE